MENLISNFNSNDIEIRDCIAISIDIRNSTNFHKKQGNENSSKIVASFISKCYVEMNKNNIFNNYIYAGDGIIGICYTDNNEKAFNNIFMIALKLKQIILEYDYFFKAGIGISFGKTAIVQIKDLKTKFNNTLYTGDSVSIASKLCSSMPLKHVHYKEKTYIAMSNSFYNNLSVENKLKCRKTHTKYIEKEV